MRTPHGPTKVIVYVLGACASLFALYTACFGVFGPFIQRGVHVLFLFPMVFLLYPATKKSPTDRITVLDGILAALAVLPPLYVVLENKYLTTRIMGVTSVKTIEVVLGIILVLLVIEAIRRAVAPAMAIIVSIFLAYMYLGYLLPGVLKAPKITFNRLIEYCWLLDGEGIFGTLMGTSATYVIMFCIFGSFVVVVGTGQFFSNFSRSIAGTSRGGSGKIATLSAGLFGMLTGSAVANVYATGTFTVPLMTERKYDKKFAGAVVSVASTGGQLMPPVMGSAAFLLADNLSIPYGKIALYALIPALLYYFSLWMMVDFYSKKHGLLGEKREELPVFKEVMKKCYLFIPIILIFVLLIIGRSPLFACFCSICVCVALSFVNKETRITPKKLVEALYDGGKNTVMVMAALAGANIVVVSFTKTGFALSLGSMVVSLSSGITILALILVALFAIILGMGVPTTASYVIAAAVGAYPLQQLGISALSAHMFILYFAVISNITPPVAIAAYAGANVAKSDPLKTGIEAFILGSASYIVPFAFAFDPVLLMQGAVVDVILSAITAGIGVVFLAGSCQGYLGGIASGWKRLLLLAAAVCLIIPGYLTDIVGIVLGGAIWFLNRRKGMVCELKRHIK